MERSHLLHEYFGLVNGKLSPPQVKGAGYTEVLFTLRHAPFPQGPVALGLNSNAALCTRACVYPGITL